MIDLEWLYQNLYWIVGIGGAVSSLLLAFKKVRAGVKYGWLWAMRLVAPLGTPEEIYELRQVITIDAQLSPVMRFDLRVNGSCSFISGSFLQFFGWQESDLLDTNWENVIARESRAEVDRLWKSSFHTGRDYVNEQFICKRSGEKVRCRVRARAVKNKLKKVVYFRGVVEVLE